MDSFRSGVLVARARAYAEKAIQYTLVYIVHGGKTGFANATCFPDRHGSDD